jgi:hypothetical protein
VTDEERAERFTRLQIDIDTRIADIWALAWHPRSALRPIMDDDAQRDAFGVFLRTAYARAYCDALEEDSRGRRDELSRANGYA